jgi:hypothetical protein
LSKVVTFQVLRVTNSSLLWLCIQFQQLGRNHPKFWEINTMTTDLAKLLFGGSANKSEGAPTGTDDATPSPVGAWHSDGEATALTVQTVAADTSEKAVIASINSNPPNLPNDQNHCAACGEFIQVYDTGWVILADGALIHYSGKHGMECWEQWQRERRKGCSL